MSQAARGASGRTSDTFERGEGATVHIGDIINEKYRVDRVLGTGGMGMVVEAMHLGLDERVALKFLHREAMMNPDIVQRFELEAKAASKLKSEHIAKVTDVDKRRDGTPYMVMEYLEGRDLATVVEESGPLRTEEAVEYIIQACEGLAEAHARGIVHRDVKPENLFLVTREADGWKSVKILDFGISKVALVGVAAAIESSKNDGAVMGSPYYMSPEQFRPNADIDHRADIWAVGTVLFELLTGTTAFDEVADLVQLFPKIKNEPNRQLLAFRSDAPPGLQDVINKCLQKEPAKRYQNAAELAIALLPFAPKRARVVAERASSLARAAGHEVTAQIQSVPPPPPSSSLSPGDGSLPASAINQQPKQKKSIALYALIGVIALLGIGFLALRGGGNKDVVGGSVTREPNAGGGAASTGAAVTAAKEPPPVIAAQPAAIDSTVTTGVESASKPGIRRPAGQRPGPVGPKSSAKPVGSPSGGGGDNEIRLTR